jgi:ribosomal protein S18 acetylase RimI-like enzyme
MPKVQVKRTYLELLSLAELQPATCGEEGLRLEHVAEPTPALARWLYETVGAAWHWDDRRGWSDDEWRAQLARPGVSLHVLYHGTSPIGYFELAAAAGGEVEIAYLGLLPGHHGRGYGKHLLTRAAEQAFASGAQRVWLHTCTLDHPAALANYRARGFRPFREELYEAEPASERPSPSGP